MGKQWPYLAMLLVVELATATGPAKSQGQGDPIGNLIKLSTFNGAQRVNLGRSESGKRVCFFREEGSSHRLDVGVIAGAAFIRVQHGDGSLAAEAIPKPPLQVFAGKGLTKLTEGDVKSTGQFEKFRSYDGAVQYVPNLQTEYGNGFVVVATGDAKSFLEMVASARREFVVVQSVAEPGNPDVIAIYNFNASAASALLLCAKKHLLQ